MNISVNVFTFTPEKIFLNAKERMVDALVLTGDEGRGLTAISFG